MKKVLKFIASIVICELAGVVGSFFTVPSISTWYASLGKPGFNPPNWVFAPVWIILFLLMGISLYLVWDKGFKISETQIQQPQRKLWNPISEKLWTGTWREENVVAVFCFQLFLNILWSVLFFGLKLPMAAFVEILMLWFAIIYTIANFKRVSKPAAYILLPYLLWVTFAAVLNFSIVLLN